MDKFGLGYRLKVGTLDGDTVVIEPPFTVQFNIVRNTMAQVNACQVRIYNLNRNNRDRIRFNISNWAKPLPVELSAGYGNRYARIFRGNMSQAWSVREGVNFVTQIECFDGTLAYVNGFTAETFPKGTPQKVVIQQLAASLPEVSLGAIGSFEGVLNRSNSYQGNTVQILRELTNGLFFIDDQKANALGPNEVIASSDVIVLSPSTGLLNTPVQEQSIVRFETLFEPQLQVGVMVRLDSETNKNFNGTYKCTSVRHSGIISESVASSVTTEGTFSFAQFLTGVRSAS